MSLSLKRVCNPVVGAAIRADRFRHIQLLARATVGERQPLKDVQERQEAAVPGECRPQYSAGVRPHALRVPQRHRALSQSESAGQVPGNDS